MFDLPVAEEAILAHQARLPAASTPQIVQGRAGDLCNTSGLNLSPDGALVIFDTIPPVRAHQRRLASGSALLARTDCAIGEGPCLLWTVETASAVFEPVWSTRGQTFTLLGNTPLGWPGYVYQFDVGAALRPVLRSFSQFRASAFDVVHRGAADWTADDRAAEYDRVLDQADTQSALMIGHYWSGSLFDGYLHEARDSTQLRISVDGVQTSTSLASPLLPDAALERHRDHSVRLGARGFTSDPSGSPGPARSFYWRSVYEAGSGEVVGEAGPQSFRLDRSDLAPLAEEMSAAIRQENAYLIDVGVSESASRVVATARTQTDDVIVITGQNSGVRAQKISCSDAGSVRVNVRLTDWGTPEWPIPVRFLEVEGADSIVVFVHGGPGRNGQQPAVSETVARLIDAGASVAIIEGSASTGAGLELATRIATHGAAAQRRDAELISAAVDRLRPQMRKIGFYGESFGGAYITLRELRGFDFLIGVSPYLKRRDPSSWSNPPLSHVRQQYQQRFEEAFFGSPDSRLRRSWEEDLAYRARTWVPSVPTRLLFAAEDDMARREDLLVSDDALLNTRTVYGARHNNVDQTPTGRSFLEGFISDQIGQGGAR